MSARGSNRVMRIAQANSTRPLEANGFSGRPADNRMVTVCPPTWPNGPNRDIIGQGWPLCLHEGKGPLMLIIWGLRVVYRTVGQGTFFCRKCGGDRGYRRRSGHRFITVFFIPLIPLNKTGEHVQCTRCKTRYVTEVLALPTAARMQEALPAGMRALVAAMLRAGDPASQVARRRAIEAVAGAGARGYDDAALDADIAQPAQAGYQAIAALCDQLRVAAREWYLAEVIRIAIADGPLTGAERVAAESLAARLGLTQAQVIGVITLTEQGAGQA